MAGYKKSTPVLGAIGKSPAMKPAWPRTITFAGPKRKVTKLSKVMGPKRAR